MFVCAADALKKSNLVTIYFNINDRIKFNYFIEYINKAFDGNDTVNFKLYFNNQVLDMNKIVRDFFLEQQGNNLMEWGPTIKLQYDFD